MIMSNNEFAPLLLLATTALLALVCSAVQADQNDLPDTTKLIIDDRKDLNDENFGAIIEDFGEHVSDVMTGEMEKLLNEVEARKRKSHKPHTTATSDASKPGNVDQDSIDKLKNANKIIGEEIKARIELAGRKNEGNLPQAALSMRSVSNFVASAQSKLHSAGDFISEKMSSLGRVVKGVPSKLRRLMHWPSFLNFKIKFNKTYKSLREELYRQMIYLHTQTMVGIQQLRFLFRQDRHILKATQFADMTDIEYRDIFHNGYAEGKIDARNPNLQLKADDKTKLEKLAAQGKNIFGLPVSPSSKRRRRSPEPMDLDELEEEETFDDVMESFDDDDPMDSDAEDKVVDNYAAAFDDTIDDEELSNLDNIIDDALDNKPRKSENFVPIDLRDTECIIQAEQQEGCGCCFSYASHGLASYFNCMDAKKAGAFQNKKVRPDRYAPRFIASCGRYLTQDGEPPLINGCRGGMISAAIGLIGEIGVIPFMDYEFAQISAGVFGQTKPDKCAYPRPKTPEEFRALGKIKVPMLATADFRSLKGLDEVNLHLRTVGPVTVNMFTWPDFKLHGAGIYDGRQWAQEPVMHSMLIIGHEQDQNGRDYYLLLNSHGTAWGERGVGRIYAESMMTYIGFFGGIMPSDKLQQSG